METLDRTVEELIRVAAAGGGFAVSAARLGVNDIVRVAAAASGTKARLYVTGCGAVATNDLVRIGAAGKGAVFFEP